MASVQVDCSRCADRTGRSRSRRGPTSSSSWATCSSASAQPTRCASSRSSSRRARRPLSDPNVLASAPAPSSSTSALSRLEEALAEIAEIPVALERPGDPRTATTRRTSRSGSQARAREPPLDIAGRDRRARRSSAGSSSGRRRRRPGLRQPPRLGCMARGGARRDPRRRRHVRRGARPTTPQRIQVEMVSANPTGPITVASARNGAYGDSVARLLEFAGHDVEREYYYNDAGAQMERFRDVGGSDPARCGASRGRLPRRVHVASWPRLAGDPVPAMLERIEQTLERFRVHFDTWARESEVEADIPEAIAAPRHVRGGRGACGRARARTATTRTACSSARTARRRTSRRTPRTSRDKLARASTSSSTCSAPITTATSRASQALAEMLGHSARCGRGARVPARPPRRARADEEDVETPRRRRLPRRAAGRDRRGRRALVPRLARPRPDDRDRHGPRGGADAEEPRLLRPVRARPDRRDPPQRARSDGARGAERNRAAAPLENEERELVKRLLEFPALVAEAAERRGPHALPTYAIRVADDFHRFYHHHRVLGSENEAFRLALSRATQLVVARSPRPRRGRGARTM